MLAASTWGTLLWLPGPAMVAARVLQPLLDTRRASSAAACQRSAVLLRLGCAVGRWLEAQAARQRVWCGARCAAWAVVAGNMESMAANERLGSNHISKRLFSS